MKKIFTLLSLSLAMTFANAQSTLTLQPDPNDGKDAFLASSEPARNFGIHPEFSGDAWTCSGSPCFGRGLLQFDLSSIPAGSVINSAYLSLHANLTPANGNGIATQGVNEAVISRVTSTWSEMNVTWNTMPSFTSVNEVILSTSSTNYQDYLNIDVKLLVQDMMNDPANSFGFMLKLLNETAYASMIFASSDYPTEGLRPQIVIEYTPANCSALVVESPSRDDAYLSSIAPSVNYSLHEEFSADAWTCGGTPCFGHGVLKFDLSAISSTAVVSSATLDLYANPTPLNGNGIAMNGANASWLERITSSWDGTVVTWDVPPTTTQQNRVALAQSATQFQDYPGIDVTSLVADMVANPTSSFGFMLKLDNEVAYASMIFASSNYPDLTKHPKLTICYSDAIGIDEINSEFNSVDVYPNPFKNNLSISVNLKSSSKVNLFITDITGRVINTYQFDHLVSGPNKIEVNSGLTDLSSGVYFVNIQAGTSSVCKKVVRF